MNARELTAPPAGQVEWTCTAPDGRVKDVAAQSWYMAKCWAAAFFRCTAEEIQAVQKGGGK
jgi:hypothetical protein